MEREIVARAHAFLPLVRIISFFNQFYLLFYGLSSSQRFAICD